MPLITKTEAKKKGIPSKTLQTIELPKSKFNLTTAKAWLKKHNYANSYYRTTDNYYRMMQTPDIKGANYYSKKLPNGVILVFQEY
jgi:hypothetical protein